MKKLLFPLFLKLFQEPLKEILNKQHEKGKIDYKKSLDKLKNDVTVAELELMLGSPVISISNEWCDPIIGIANRIEYITLAKSPILVVKDYITQKEKYVLGKTYFYTEQRLNAIFKLDPFELCSIIYNNIYYDTEFKKEKLEVRKSLDEVREILKNNDFFSDIKKNKKTQNLM